MRRFAPIAALVLLALAPRARAPEIRRRPVAPPLPRAAGGAHAPPPQDPPSLPPPSAAALPSQKPRPAPGCRRGHPLGGGLRAGMRRTPSRRGGPSSSP
jgi:hypothetical protein